MGKTGLKMWIQEVSPHWAEKKLNEAKPEVLNRHTSDAHVHLLAKTMSEGKWVTGASAIILDEDDFLIDGQHRLWAVCESGKTIQMVVIEGANRDQALPVIDLDRLSRSVADAIEIKSPTGHPISNPKAAQAATRWFYRYRNQQIFMGNPKVSARTLLELLGKNPGLIDSISMGEKLKGLVPSISLASFCHYIFVQRNRDLADQLFDKLSSGANLSVGDPALALREKLIAYRRDNERRSMDHIVFIFFRTWLYIEAGLEVRRLSWRRQGTEEHPAEPFPYLDTYPSEAKDLRKMLRRESA